MVHTLNCLFNLPLQFNSPLQFLVSRLYSIFSISLVVMATEISSDGFGSGIEKGHTGELPSIRKKI